SAVRSQATTTASSTLTPVTGIASSRVPAGTARPAGGTPVGIEMARTASVGVTAPTTCDQDRTSGSAAGSTPTGWAATVSAALTCPDPGARPPGCTLAPGATAAYCAMVATSSGRSNVVPTLTVASRGTAKAAWSAAPWRSVSWYAPAKTTVPAAAARNAVVAT